MSTALITGASAGLGSEFARLFAKDGHNLILVARRKDRLSALANELSQVKVTVIDLDLGAPGAGRSLFNQVKDQKVDYLVNNAGFGSVGAFDESDHANQMQMIDLNVRTLVELSHLFLPAMKERGFGRILNVGSTAGFQPGPFMATYFATKAFVNSFSEALNEELRGTGVSCTVLAPGATVTEFAKVANLEKSRLFAFASDNASDVAKDGYRAMIKGQSMVVSGLKNKIQTSLVGFIPRAMVVRAVRSLNENR